MFDGDDIFPIRIQMPRPQQSRDSFHLLALLTGVVVVATLYFAKVVVVPIALALLFAFLLTTPVTWLQRIRVHRVPAALLVLTLAVAGVGAVGWTVTKQVFDVSSQLPSYKINLKNKIDSLRTRRSDDLHKASETVKELSKELTATPTTTPSTSSSTSRAANQLTNSGSGSQSRPIPVEVVDPPSTPLESIPNLLGPVGTLGIVIVFTLVMMIRREDLRDRIIRLAGEGHIKTMTEALDEAGNRVSRYLLLQLMVNASYGIVVGVGLHFIGIPNSLLWGVIAGTMRFLPYLGSPIGGILPILLSLALFDGWARPLMTVALFVILEIVVSNLLEPVLYGAHTGLSSMAILFAALFWMTLWGPIGLILSTPLTVCLVVMGRHVPHLSFLQVLLGDEPGLTPETRFYQRLLAMDQDEARQILEEDSYNGSLVKAYDSVIIPALCMLEQDRHRDILEESSETFIFESTKEIIEQQFEKYAQKPGRKDDGVNMHTRDLSGIAEVQDIQSRPCKVICIPAGDEADEIVGIMLAQLVREAGYRAQCIPVGVPLEMLAQLLSESPDIICISALPPLAIGSAGKLYRKLRTELPQVKILVGLWKFAGEAKWAAGRIGTDDPESVFTTLAQGVEKIKHCAEGRAEDPIVRQEVLKS